MDCFIALKVGALLAPWLLIPRLGIRGAVVAVLLLALWQVGVLLIAVNKWDVAEHASGLFNGIRAALDVEINRTNGRPGKATRARPWGASAVR